MARADPKPPRRPLVTALKALIYLALVPTGDLDLDAPTPVAESAADAIDPDEFTDSPVHLTPAGTQQLAHRLQHTIIDIANEGND